MNSLLEIVESALPKTTAADTVEPQPLAPAQWDWANVRKILVVRLRSIGDTVLATPSLIALKRFVPNAQLDILLEDWVAPVLSGFAHVDNIITLKRGSSIERAKLALRLRASHYDVVYNLHGGTTATLLTRATGAKHRVGYATYQYAGLHQHRSPASSLLWEQHKTHSVEQQLALLGWTGVPVTDRPRTQLGITQEASTTISNRLREHGFGPTNPFVLIHPAAAFATKEWATEKFAKVADVLALRGLATIAVAAPKETAMVESLKQLSSVPIVAFTDLSLPEVTALAAEARLFIGNDSGIAHIAAAVKTPAVVIFGSSNVDHWRPWFSAPAEVVRELLDCQPCHGYFCEKFSEPECIRRVPVESVLNAADRVLRESAT